MERPPDIAALKKNSQVAHEGIWLEYARPSVWHCCHGAKSCAVVGAEHEDKLNNMLTEAGIAFWTEDDLRNKGFYKTPDAKLQVLYPIFKCLPKLK